VAQEAGNNNTTLRHDLAHVIEYSKRNSSSKIEKSARRIFSRYNVHSAYNEENTSISEFLVTLN
jgi:hypothetical protein